MIDIKHLLSQELFWLLSTNLMCLQESVGTWGLTGLDRLLCFMIVQELQNFVRVLQRSALHDKVWLDTFATISKSLAPTAGTVGKDSWSLFYIVGSVGVDGASHVTKWVRFQYGQCRHDKPHCGERTWGMSHYRQYGYMRVSIMRIVGIVLPEWLRPNKSPKPISHSLTFS